MEAARAHARTALPELMAPDRHAMAFGGSYCALERAMNRGERIRGGAIAAESRSCGFISHGAALLRRFMRHKRFARHASSGVDRHIAYHRLLDALERPGCPVCALLAEGTAGWFDSLFREMVNDPEIRLRIRRSLGFCKGHGDVAAARGAALGLALIYQDVVEHALERLRRRGSGPGGRALAVCPACEDELVRAATYVRTLADYLVDPAVQSAYAASDGLCIRHVEMLVDVSADSVLDLVVANEVIRLDALASDLREFIRKSDYRFGGEPFGNERDCVRRAASKCSGARTAAEDG